MIVESILNEMEQREGEKTHKFLSRQQTARNVIRKINSLEVHLGHLMADSTPRGKVGDSLNNEDRTKTAKETKESIRTIA